MKLALTLIIVAALAGCADLEQRTDETARAAARIAVTKTIVTRFPAVPKELVTPFTDCIIDNSRARDIRIFAQAAVVGVDDTTVAAARDVLARPETIQCLGAASGTAALTF